MIKHGKSIGIVVGTAILLGTITTVALIASKARERDYYVMQAALDEVTYSIDTDKYSEAILFLCSSDKTNKEKVAEAKEKFKDTIDSELLNILDSKIDITESVAMEDMDMESAYDNSSSTVQQDENSYPIYSMYLNIIGYGTKEESEQSLRDFMSRPENTISSSSVYKDTILFRVVNKVSGEKMIRVNIDNGKISDYKIYLNGGN